VTVYIHQLPDWPKFTWDQGVLALPLSNVRHRQGLLLGKMESMALSQQEEVSLKTLTQDVIKSSEIEGETFDWTQVHSSIARRLGIENAGLAPVDRHVEGIVELLLDATQHFSEPLTVERLFSWHAALFPTGRSGLSKITVGTWRTDANGPMEVISGPYCKQKVHYQAPDADRLPEEMAHFLAWINNDDDNVLDPVLKAGLAHLWFLTLHPFEDGNGRIGRAIADMLLARSEKCRQRFYSLSSQIQSQRKSYYDCLERSQRGTMDVTPWLRWFLNCLSGAIQQSESSLATILDKARFWRNHEKTLFSVRQKEMANRLLDGFEGKLNTSKWAKISNCSQDTAYRDILDLVEKGVLQKGPEGGRSAHYILAEF
jgi:Fic family protein